VVDILLDVEGKCPSQIDYAIVEKQKSYHLSYVGVVKMATTGI